MVRTQRLKNEGHRVKTQISSKGVLSVGTGTLITCRQTPMWLGLEHQGDVIMLVLRAGRGGSESGNWIQQLLLEQTLPARVKNHGLPVSF